MNPAPVTPGQDGAQDIVRGISRETVRSVSRKRQRLISLAGWTSAVLLSLGLNLFLFGIMPGLIHSVPRVPGALEDIRTVQVVRIKRPEPPPKKKEKSRPPEPEKTSEPAKQPARINAPKPALVRPSLPFELNPALPEVSNSLEMPPLSHFSMKASGPKGLYMAGELDRPLAAAAKVPPAYPLRATRMGIQGWVRVRFVVTAQGIVEHIEILEAEPEGVFENAVVNCISRWRFRPGTVEGIPVAAQAETTVRFQLDK